MTYGFGRCQEVHTFPNGTRKCDQCTTWTYFSSITKTCVDISSISYCLTTEVVSPNRDVFCQSCPLFRNIAPVLLNKDTKTCEVYNTSNATNCVDGRGELRSMRFYCLQCEPGYAINSENGWCVPNTTSPAAHLILANYSLDIQIWMEGLPGCVDGTYSSANDYYFYCVTCNNGDFIKYDPASRYCLNIDCSNDLTGINKPCTNGAAEIAAYPTMNCDSTLCVQRSNQPFLEPVTNKFYLFEMAIIDEGSLALKINSSIHGYFGFTLENYTLYDNMSQVQNIKDPMLERRRVFCPLISADLRDDQTTCIYHNNTLYLDVPPQRFRQLTVGGGILNINKDAFRIHRLLMMSMTGNYEDVSDPGFSGTPVDYVTGIFFNTNTTTELGSNWIVAHQPKVVFSQGFQLDVLEIDGKVNLLSYRWECIRVVGGDLFLRNEMNSTLQAFANNSVSISLTNTSWIGKTFTIMASMVDEFQRSHAFVFDMEVVNIDRAFDVALNSPVFYSESTTGVYIPLLPMVQNILPASIIVTPIGLTGTMTSQIIQKADYFLLELKITNGNHFNVSITYSAYTETRFTLAHARSRAPSVVIHEATADNITPFTVQMINRASSFDVFCVDVTNKNWCLANSTYTQGDLVTMATAFNHSSTGSKYLFFRSATRRDQHLASSIIDAKTTAQPSTPEISTKNTVSYPESPFFKPNQEYFLGFRTNNISSVSPIAQQYLDKNWALQSTSVPYTVNKGLFQLDQPTYISAIKMVSQVQVTLNDSTIHKVYESRVISDDVTSSLLIKTSINSGYLQTDLIVKESSRGTCNEPLSEFTNQVVIDDKFIIGEFGTAFRFSLMPKLFSTYPVTVISRALTNCGPVISTSSSLQDTTSADFVPSLAGYVNNMMINLGSSNRDTINNLNMVMAQLSYGYYMCTNKSMCLATKEEWVAQTAAVLAYLPPTFDQNKYTMTSRYSLLGSFLWHDEQVNDTSIKTIYNGFSSSSLYIKNKIKPALQANHRFSRALSLEISTQNLIQADLVDFPIQVSYNMLSSFLFSYANNTDRNDFLNKSIIEIVNHKELKMLRVSSNKREEVFVNDFLKVQGTTILTDLEAQYDFDLDSETKLVFKNLKFENPTQYYDVIIISWLPKLIDKMWTYYNDSTNGFIKSTFYIDFRSYFDSNIPIKGEGQILKKKCTEKKLQGCSSTSIPDYEVCSCFNLNTTTAQPPKTDRLPPGVVNQPKTTTPLPIPLPPTDPGSGGIANKLGNDVGVLVNNKNKDHLDLTKVTNFSVWCFSTIGIQLVFLVLYGLGVVLWKAMDRKSVNFCEAAGTSLLVHLLMLDEVRTQTKLGPFDEERKSPISKNVENPGGKSVTNSGSSGSEDEINSSGISYQNLTIAQCRVKAKLEDLKPEVDMKIVEKTKYKPLKWYQIYNIYLKLNHMFSSLLCLKSGQYSKITLLTLTFLRMITHLSISMYFTLGSF